MRSIGLLLAFFSLFAEADVVSGRVVNVSSGDTLTIVDRTNQRHKIHLIGLAAPDIVQAFGQTARTGLSAIAFNQHVQASCRLHDQLQHALCIVYQGGLDIGLKQLREGMAWANPAHDKYLSVQERSVYQQAEFFAKIHRGGLWNSKNPTPPWVFRNGRPE